MAGKSIFFTQREMRCLLDVLKSWNNVIQLQSGTEICIDKEAEGLGSAYYKLLDKYTEASLGTEIRETMRREGIHPGSEEFLDKLRYKGII